jgi:hypothetical protein
MATTPRAADPRRLVTIYDAAGFAGVSPRTIRRRISDGTLTGYRAVEGRVLRVDMNEVERALFEVIPTVGCDSGGAA